ncbi:AAA domain-containing protein [Microbacterium sp. 1P06AB]|uniref:bifunctional RecB family nuclease/DEAD/DEAH box helicase n=1 Tax=Microbacterium sp. 1P06AB TaxID=3132289 RepID=UPI0039A63014
MPRIDKTAFVDFASTGCEKQLRIDLHPQTSRHQRERDRFGIVRPQVRPVLREMTAAGNEWGEAKVRELEVAFGEARLMGGPRTLTGSPPAERLQFAKSELRPHLSGPVRAGDFFIETSFPVATQTFRDIHGLADVDVEGREMPLDFSDARPDIIEVLAPQAGRELLTATGALVRADAADGRLVLRVIDVKLTSEPGPRYFSELAYYSLALAAWLQENHLDDRFAVSADAAVWPGSETTTTFAELIATGVTEGRYEALHALLELAPLRIFVAEVLRLLRQVIPRLLATPFDEIPWSVTPACQGCENLGQRFRDEPGDQASDWDPAHCLPVARAQQHLSRLPYLSRGSLKVLKDHGHADVGAVADLDPEDPTYSAHHRLRAQRAVLSTRARALRGDEVEPVDVASASTAAIPSYAKLRIYITADFDPGSAITFAFGLTYAWMSKDEPKPTFPRMRLHYTRARTTDEEWQAVSALLGEIDSILRQAEAIDRNAPFQVYVWDQLTLDHLTRVISRHLPRILGSNLSRLAWLFPPAEVVGNARITSTPAVSVVKDAVRGLVSLNLAHNYNLLDTARRFHRGTTPNAEFRTPTFWTDPFSDQIPPERAHQMWQNRHVSGRQTPAQLSRDLQQTVNSKLAALSNVTDHLTTLLRGRLPRSAPSIRQLQPPEDLSASSHLGALLYAHTRLEAALTTIEVSLNRALPLDEREAKFLAAHLLERAPVAEAEQWLADAGIPGAPDVYVLSLDSTEFKGKEGDFTWTMLPAELVHLADTSVGAFLTREGETTLLSEAAWRTRMGDIFGVTIRGIDRRARLIAVELTAWDADLRNAILGAGLVNLDRDLVLDETSKDFLSKPLSEAIKAIGTPPSAARDPRIQQALGSARRPRTTAAHPAEHFLWTPTNTATTPVTRDLPALRAQIDQRHRLDDSQQRAWEAALSRRLTLIWGPPGTGKTQTVRAILAGLLAEASARPLRIAVTANTNSAMDNVTQPILEEINSYTGAVEFYRLLSAASTPPAWLPARHVVSTAADSATLRPLYQRLRRGESTVVAGLTQQLTKLIKLSRSKQNIGLFDVLIIDEAGALDVPRALLALEGVADGATVIVAGDPLQLPPIRHGEPPLGLEAMVGSIYDFFAVGHGVPAVELHNNYRSNTSIVDLARRAGYPAQLQAIRPDRRIAYASEADGREDWPDAIPYSDEVARIADPQLPVVCVTYDEGVSGQWNQFEVEQVAALVIWYRKTLFAGVDGTHVPLTDEYFWNEAVGVVTPHRAQRARIVDTLVRTFAVPGSDARLPEWIAGAVDTVERFQGQERDVIVASYAVGDPDTIAEEAEFLLNLNRFNVLATRAKAKLVVFASRELVSYLGSDLKVLRSSGLLKDFVGVFCDQTRDAVLSWQERGVVHDVGVEVRWAGV